MAAIFLEGCPNDLDDLRNIVFSYLAYQPDLAFTMTGIRSDMGRASLLVEQAQRDSQKLPDINKAYVLSSLDEAYINLNDGKRAALLLEQAIRSAEISSNDFYKAYTLNAVIRLATKAGKVKMARDAALINVSDNQKASALALILRTYANRNNPDIDEHKDELQR